MHHARRSDRGDAAIGGFQVKIGAEVQAIGAAGHQADAASSEPAGIGNAQVTGSLQAQEAAVVAAAQFADGDFAARGGHAYAAISAEITGEHAAATAGAYIDYIRGLQAGVAEVQCAAAGEQVDAAAGAAVQSASSGTDRAAADAGTRAHSDAGVQIGIPARGFIHRIGCHGVQQGDAAGIGLQVHVCGAGIRGELRILHARRGADRADLNAVARNDLDAGVDLTATCISRTHARERGAASPCIDEDIALGGADVAAHIHQAVAVQLHIGRKHRTIGNDPAVVRTQAHAVIIGDQ